MRAFRNLFYKPVKIIAKTAGVPVVKKKKSYKEIRPRGTRAPITDYSDPVRPGVLSASAKPAAPAKPAAKKAAPPKAAVKKAPVPKAAAKKAAEPKAAAKKPTASKPAAKKAKG